MSDAFDSIAKANRDLAATPSEKQMGRGTMFLSIIGLIAGVVALALATIPAIALERSLPNPFADTKKMEREGGVTVKFKNLSVNVGGKVPKKEQIADAPLEITKDPVRWFTMAAIGCALVGLVVATIGQLRERHTMLTVSSMGCCTAAITWQYFAIGIAVGAAAAAFLIVFAILSSAIN